MKALNLGNYLGIDIHVHPTFGLVFVWAFFQWGVGENGGVLPFVLGVVFVLFLLISVLIHEIGHILMARHLGTSVLDVTLWPFGGVARIEQNPASPRSELLIAIAGPAMNLAVFFALLPPILLIWIIGGWDAVLPDSSFLEEITLSGLPGYVAITNLINMLFNLVPAFPMDGGRALRALLTPLLGRGPATSTCVWIGIVLAVIMIGLGIWQTSLLLIILGCVVIIGANAEGRSIRVESAMRRLRVGQFAMWDGGGVGVHESLTLALRGGPRDAAVIDRGRVVGMLWRDQLLSGLQGGMSNRRVRDVMDPDIYIASTDDSVFDVQLAMTHSGHWVVPVVEDGQYRGIFTAEQFVQLYRQIAPGVFSNRLTIPEEWRLAITENFRAMRRRN